MAAGALIVLVLALAGPVVLYLLVRSEADRTETMDRSTAHRVARRDTHDGRENQYESDADESRVR